ncbi:hypothetical protein C7C46_04700 [Streptomyces tateyamensis]|uniref:Ig-like domain-containing protein n=1 Tax=Streptomyces tateyamensis TaxID=565073 RepID=A0A2V4P1M2_9ACTN|nr:hypothetical protein [Streptomyces tateyamensis]PYC87383.1 hypothetical protein C7C46_04700 [Streptomyces tateyamensis]
MAVLSKLVGLAAAALAVSGAGVAQLATAAPAAAMPICQRYWTWDSGTIFCPSADNYWNGYEFQVVITCVHDGVPYAVTSPLVRANTTVSAYCNGSDPLQSTNPPSVTWQFG